MAVAYIGRHLNVPVTIVVPETTSKEAKQRIEDEGASVLVHGKVWSLLISKCTKIKICVSVEF